jgi:hypothetical protein
VLYGEQDLQGGDVYLPDLFRVHADILDQLLARLPGGGANANRVADTHWVCGKALWSLYGHIAPYMDSEYPFSQRALLLASDERANAFRDLFVTATNHFRAHEITLGTRPPNAVDNEFHMGWSETGKLTAEVQRMLTQGEKLLSTWRKAGPPPGQPNALAKLEAVVAYQRQIRAALPAQYVLLQ